MRVAFCLGGTDLGRSGLGVWARAVLPRLTSLLGARGDSIVALGEAGELAAYAGSLAGVETARMPSSFGAPAVSALQYLAVSGRLARRAGADVLFLPAANRRCAHGSSLPTVAVVHDFACFRIAGQSDALRNAYRRHLVLGALRTVTEIVAVSGVTRDDLVDLLGSSPPPIRVIPNGVEAVRFAPRAPGDPAVGAARARAGLTRPYLLYPARLEHPQKNHLRLLAAFAQSRAAAGHDLALSGGDWGARSLVEQEVARLGLGGRVHLLGFVADEDLPLLVAGADAVVMVGLHEGFGLPALEALSAGRPVVASTTGALPEVVGDLSAPCDPMDVGSISRALDRALTDPTLRERAAREGPRHARARSWDTAATSLLAACDDALARARV